MARSVPKIVADLSRGILVDRMHATEALAGIATTDEARSEIIAAGAAAPLVQLLSATVPEGGSPFWASDARAKATALLGNLASLSSCCNVILSEGALRPILESLSSAAPEIREQAAIAVQIMVRDDRVSTEILASGALAQLVNMLPSSTTHGKAKIASALATIASKDDNAKPVVSAGALPQLLILLGESQPESCRIAAALALEHIASLNLCRKAVFDAGALPLLVERLRCGGTEEERQAAAAIRAIVTEGNEELPPPGAPREDPPDALEMIDTGFVPLLVDLLSRGSAECRSEAARGIFAIADRGAECHPTIIAAGALPPLIALLSNASVSAETIGYAGCALRLLAATPQNREAMEASLPRGPGREAAQRRLQLYCF